MDKRWEKASEEVKGEKKSRPSLTFWQDAWRRLKQNKLSMIGLVVIILLFITAIFGPMFSKFSYEDQDLKFGNIAPRFDIYQVNKDNYIYVHPEYKIFTVTDDGKLLDTLRIKKNDIMKLQKVYELDGQEIILDYGNAKLAKKDRSLNKFKILINGKEAPVYKRVFNKTYKLGTDTHGRDLLIRIIYGARISLTVAVVDTLVNFFIGIFYGVISGYLC
jgi:oligopeptide transport system permease protein